MYNKTFFLMLCFILLSISVRADLPESSPAGGNYLALDGKDDYAVLDFDDFGNLFEKETKELTVEAWIYPTLIPDKDILSVILSQQIVIYTVGDGHPIYQNAKNLINLNNDDLVLLMFAYTNPNNSTGSMYLALSRNEWHHVAFQVSQNQIAWICDNTSSSLNWGISSVMDDISKIPDWPKDFVLGGYGKRTFSQNIFWDSFAGYIDEVRISNIARYDIAEKHTIPQGRFETDANTIALWHFDESIGTETFKDSSNKKYHLTGMNGASVRGAFAVNSNGKLTTTWSAIKVK